MNEVITAEFVVYGRDIEEIRERARMIGRRFFGSLQPTYTFQCEPLMTWRATDPELYKAEVSAVWDPEIHST